MNRPSSTIHKLLKNVALSYVFFGAIVFGKLQIPYLQKQKLLLKF